MVGTDAHDRLYLDANGNIQYLNLQSGGGTPDDYSFVLDEDGHNQNNLPFSKKEQELYGLDEEDAFFTNMVSIPRWRSHPIHENRATKSIWTEPCNSLLRATKSTKRATSA